MPKKENIEEEAEEEVDETLDDDEIKNLYVEKEKLDIPDDIKDLLIKYRDNAKLSRQEKATLFTFLLKIPKKAPLMPALKELGFSDKRYYSLKSNLHYFRKKIDEAKKEIIAEEKLLGVEKRDFANWITENWNTLKKLGEKVIIEYSEKAKNRGMSIMDYVVTALDFYEQYVDRLDEIDEEIQDLQALVKMFKEAANVNFAKLSALRIYMEFQTELLKLKASGIQVPDTILEDFKKKTDFVIASLGVNISNV